MPDIDVAVIGAGPAGLSVAALAAGLGLRVVLFERGAMGGAHLHGGTVPAQALLAAGRAAAAARRAGRFGIRLPPPAIDWAGVQAHVASRVAALAPNAAEARLEAMGVQVVRAPARFAARDAVAAAGRHYRFRRAVVATGSAPAPPELPGLADLPCLAPGAIAGLAAPPGHLLVLGGTAHGLEMAQACARLGCRVTLLDRGTIAGAEDPEMLLPLRRALAEDGVALVEDAEIAAATATPEGGVTLALRDGRRVGGSHLLLATPRLPVLAGLDLAAAGVAAGERGIRTDRGLRSLSNRRVWAAGDVADPEGLGPRPSVQAAAAHAATIARGMLFRLPARLSPAAWPRAIFTEPEIAQIGPTEAELRAAGAPGLTVLRWPLAENDRAVIEGRPEGLVKLVVDRRGRLRGASVVGPEAAGMAALLGMSIGRPVAALAEAVLPGPTRAEAAKRAAAEYHLPRLMGMKRLARMLMRLPW